MYYVLLLDAISEEFTVKDNKRSKENAYFEGRVGK
jgi:hypothetical protein